MGFGADFPAARVKARPFIKWAGGKWQLLPAMAAFMPPEGNFERYFEPFLGGAAVFFSLQHPRSVLSDRNEELAELYQVVKNNVEALIETLKGRQNEREYFYQVRGQNRADLSPVQRAGRFIYLNRTCYNGLYRVNSTGQFNVPFGKYKNPTICDADGLRAASHALRETEIIHADFEEVTARAGKRDFVYFDPPYQPLSKTSSFTAYTSEKFDEKEQERLANTFASLDRRGSFVMLSNSDTPLIRELYRAFQIHEIQASRAINSKPEGRGKITELLITNY